MDQTEFERRKRQIATLLMGMNQVQLLSVNNLVVDFYKTNRQKVAALESMKYRIGEIVRVKPPGRLQFLATVISINRNTLTLQRQPAHGGGKVRAPYSLISKYEEG